MKGDKINVSVTSTIKKQFKTLSLACKEGNI